MNLEQWEKKQFLYVFRKTFENCWQLKYQIKTVKDILSKVELIETHAIFLFLLSTIVLLLTLKKIIRKKKNEFYLWAIVLYIFLITVQLLIGLYYHFVAPEIQGKQSPTNISAYIFVVLEYSIFALLLSKFIHSTAAEKYLPLSCILFGVVAILVWQSNSSFYKAFSVETAIESISLIPFCLYYFFELLNNPPLLKLTSEPAFWITTGILFLFICITPYYLVFDYFKKINEMQMIDFFGYDLVVLFLAKASFTKSKSANG